MDDRYGTTYDGKRVFVAGGSEGIGKAVGQAFAAAGADVAILSRSPEKLTAALGELEARRTHAGQVLVSRSVDIRDFEACRTAIDVLVDELGTPDIVVTCAGFARPGYIDDLDIEHFRAMMDLNYFGTVHVSKAVIPHLVRAGRGTIVNTSSMAGLVGVFGYTGYSASKYAVRGFSEALRRELRPFGIRVSVLCPPNTRTPGFDEENRYKPAEVLRAEEKVSTVEPEFVAEQLLRRLPSDPFLIIPTRDGRLAYLLSRYLPAIVDRAVRRPDPVEKAG